jgi:hypothetical protein
LIDRARTRDTLGYVEKHHVIPKCLGGPDSKDNIVKLYPEEHYLAHLLLCKIYQQNSKLVYAAMNMTSGAMVNNGKRNNKAYGWLRRQYAESMSGDNNPARRNPDLQKEAAKKRVGQKRTEETKEKMSLAQKGRTFSEETKAKMSAAAKARPEISDSTRAKLKRRRPNRGMLGKTHSVESVQKISVANRGRVDSDETRLKKSAAAKRREENKRKLKDQLDGKTTI